MNSYNLYLQLKINGNKSAVISTESNIDVIKENVKSNIENISTIIIANADTFTTTAATISITAIVTTTTAATITTTTAGILNKVVPIADSSIAISTIDNNPNTTTTAKVSENSLLLNVSKTAPLINNGNL